MAIAAHQGLVWITGASTGIGRALAQRLARHGYEVVASARGADKLNTLTAERAGGGGPIHALPMDVGDSEAVAAGIAAIEAEAGRPVATAVLNAGTHRPLDVTEFRSETFEQLLRVNVMGVVNGLAAVLPGMIARRAGTVAIVSSVAGYSGLPTAAAYGASKAALINMAEALKVDLAPHGVRVVLVCPGFVETPLTDKNPFPMPFLMPLDKAVERLHAGLESEAFEVTFPRRFTYIVKFMRLLPYWLYFPLVRRFTGL